METTNKIYIAYSEILKTELIPAQGCTEPIALAYAAALARATLGSIPKKVYIGASGSIIKNVKSVIVPNSGNMKGIIPAAAMGIVAGDENKQLLVISNVKNSDLENINNYIKATTFTITPIDYGEVFDIVIKVTDDKNSATVRISKYHTNITLIEKNGKIIKGKSINDSLIKTNKNNNETKNIIIDEYKKLLNINDIIDYANSCKSEEIIETIKKQVEYNIAIAKEGMKNNYGSNIGKLILNRNPNDLFTKIIAYAAAGSDARMNGCEMPVVINSGSGNQGITVSVPIYLYCKGKNIDDNTMYKALIVSNLLSIYAKFPIGTLSAFCGAVTAAAAVGGAITYIEKGTLNDIGEVVQNALGISAGIICDGAKSSCAAKIALALNSSLLGILMNKSNNNFKNGDGIIKNNFANTVEAVGTIGREGMTETNKKIIDIMINK